MKKEKIIYMYIKNDELDLDEVIDDFSGYLWTIIKNAGIYQNEDIEDIISDTYLILWNNRSKLDLNKKLSSYLVGIVRNLIRKRYSNIYNKKENYENIEDFQEKIISNEKIDLIIEKDEINNKILEILDLMKKEDLNIFYEYYYYHKKVREIAKKFNISESNVKIRLYRIRNKIKKELRKENII